MLVLLVISSKFLTISELLEFSWKCVLFVAVCIWIIRLWYAVYVKYSWYSFCAERHC